MHINNHLHFKPVRQYIIQYKLSFQQFFAQLKVSHGLLKVRATFMSLSIILVSENHSANENQLITLTAASHWQGSKSLPVKSCVCVHARVLRDQEGQSRPGQAELTCLTHCHRYPRCVCHSAHTHIDPDSNILTVTLPPLPSNQYMSVETCF